MEALSEGGMYRNVKLSHADLTRPADGIVPFDDKEAIIEVRAVDVVYGKLPVIHDIYCHFPRKTITSITKNSSNTARVLALKTRKMVWKSSTKKKLNVLRNLSVRPSPGPIQSRKAPLMS